MLAVENGISINSTDFVSLKVNFDYLQLILREMCVQTYRYAFSLHVILFGISYAAWTVQPCQSEVSSKGKKLFIEEEGDSKMKLVDLVP